MSIGLDPLGVMRPGDPSTDLTSANGSYRLTLQTDGNLVIYFTENGRTSAIWSAATNGKAVQNAVMQDDGNFVIYGFPNPKPNPLWATNTVGQPGAFLILQDDGSLIVVRQYNQALWSTATQGQ